MAHSFSSLSEIPPNWRPIRLLTANVGNLSSNCRGRYNNKLCEKEVEENISQNIKSLRPDVVFFQELMHPSQCDDWVENDTQKVCYKVDGAFEPNQARRLLGSDYSILCAARIREHVGHSVGMECIAVGTDVGMIQGCLPGQICFAQEGLDMTGEKCNPEFVVMSAVVYVGDLRLKLINAHPHSRDRNCRDHSLAQIFEEQESAPILGGENRTIIAGDFNFDPFRNSKNTPQVWQKHVGLFGSGKPFYYHSGLAEHDPPYPSAYFLYQKKTIDHVLSNFAAGTCVTLGEAPGTVRIDGGEGMDHRAILCELWIPPNNSSS